jgi:hypothetical protein
VICFYWCVMNFKTVFPWLALLISFTWFRLWWLFNLMIKLIMCDYAKLIFVRIFMIYVGMMYSCLFHIDYRLEASHCSLLFFTLKYTLKNPKFSTKCVQVQDITLKKKSAKMANIGFFPNIVKYVCWQPFKRRHNSNLVIDNRWKYQSSRILLHALTHCFHVVTFLPRWEIPPTNKPVAPGWIHVF